MELKVLYEDEYIAAVVKPPGIPSQPDKTGDADMVALLSAQLGAKGFFVVHRLDRPVGGVMVYAKNVEAAAALSKEIQMGQELEKTQRKGQETKGQKAKGQEAKGQGKQAQKKYYAVVCGIPEKKNGRLIDYLVKNERTNTSAIAQKGNPRAKQAVLNYSVLSSIETAEEGCLSFVEISLETGRHHQIRVQLSHMGCPIWGDHKYHKGLQRGRKRAALALWAFSLSICHPVTKKQLVFQEWPEGYPFSLFLKKT